ncbi:MAG: T9SS type A sorting domain-containing protein [Bacteroidia bacterium]|nr:T9SS type A sorting domain-containing protein [Bacteroidia bacterium]
MKKLILLLSVVFVTNQTKAQSSILLTNNGTATTLAPNSVIYETTQASSNTKVTIDVKNTSGSTKSYIAKRYDVLLHATNTSTAVAYFCIAGSCYGPPTIVSPDPLVLNSMQSASELQGPYQMLVGDLDEAETVGESHVKYTFQNTNDANDSVQISVKYNATPAGIKKNSVAANILNIIPNPAANNFNLQFTSDVSVSSEIVIQNAVGQVVLSKNYQVNVGKNDVWLDISNLSKGIYFLNLNTGNSTSTKKLVIN